MLEDDTETRRRARWKKSQQARRQRLSDGGKVQFRVWVTPEEATWLAQVLADRRKTNEAMMQRRAERLKQLLKMARAADASSRW